jgi:tetratricopeptide (TPR) repeat protein
MNEKETSRENSAVPAPSSREETAGKSSPSAEEKVKRPADQFQVRQLELFKQSLVAEGEAAYKRWGMLLFHSLSDEEAEAQRRSLGFEIKDALDYYNHGCMLVGREDFAGAVKTFDHAIELDSNLPEAVFNKAMALESLGDLAAARQTWLAYLEKYGENEDAGEVKQHLESLTEA